MSKSEDEAAETEIVKIIPEVERYYIPRELLEAWDKVPPEEIVKFELSRRDVHNLYLAIMGSYHVVSAVQRSLTALIGKRMEEANSVNQDAANMSAEGVNALRLFMTAVIGSSLSQDINLEGDNSDA